MTNTNTNTNVLGVGNAIVDVLTHASEEFIADQHAKHGMEKGGMMLIETDRATQLYGEIGQATEMSGGSAANTIAIIAGLGGSASFIGKVADDQLGDVFAHDLQATGVQFTTPRLTDDVPTARCFILVTPDAQRTMNTYLGAAAQLNADDIDEAIVADAQVSYLEGYLFDKDHAKQAFRRVGELAHKHGNEVALSLSDSFCVERHRADFQDLVENHIDILFANEQEIMALYETETFEQAQDIISGKCKLAALTRGDKGSVILNQGETVTVNAVIPAKLEDTTGAGDAYAGGFLYGYTNGYSLKQSAELGTVMATEIISHMGPRTDKDLKVFTEGLKKAS
jgi:sugar/nucleoside kinase (ribokinase family)